MEVSNTLATEALRLLALADVSYFDLRTLASLERVSSSLTLTDRQWKRVAHAYVTEPAFWTMAAARPFKTARPLPSWKDELQRLVGYKKKCRHLGFVIDDAYIMRSWQYIDNKSVRNQSLRASTFCCNVSRGVSIMQTP
uniref:Uncharacterized protein n=1 Tax=viral metagenome TaxID=1070528 RepID=A0A6C0C200_9ZZZZ